MRTHEPAYELLHVKEAAAELGVHPGTIRRHIHAGDLEAVRLGDGGRYRVTRAALEEFLRPARSMTPAAARGGAAVAGDREDEQ
jgi:excisionase family DNA binding protein